jgi:DNA repair exonuclease SbcCD ATPase subunit
VFLLLVAGVLSGCQHKPPNDLRTDLDETRAEIPRIVTDPARAAGVQQAYDRLGRVLRESTRERRVLYQRWNTLYRSYDTPRESLEALIAEHARATEALRAEALEVREQVRTHTTDAEWKALRQGREKLAKHLVGGS